MAAHVELAAVAMQARALLAEGSSDEACVLLSEALEHQPSWAAGHFLLGRAEAVMGHHDSSACSFRRAGTLGSASLRQAAAENEDLIAARFVPRHALLWLNDDVRAAAWRTALTGSTLPGAAVLCAGETCCAAALHAALALAAGAARADAVVGSQYVAQASSQRVYAALEELPLLSTPYSLLCWDFGNTFSDDSICALRDAARACSSTALVLPRRVLLRGCIVESRGLAELNACESVRAGAFQFDLPAFNVAFSRSRRPVQLQHSSLKWRPLTAPFTVLDCRVTDLITSGDVVAASVSAGVLSSGIGHAVVTWLDCELVPGVWMSTGVASNAACLHATQTAHFAPAGAPWQLVEGENVELQATLAADGVVLSCAKRSFAFTAPAAFSIPDYHMAMLNDRPRNDAFATGIASALATLRVKSSAPLRVLDVGAGAGLLSMIAAAEGADEVVACERNERLASCAALDIAENGHADAVAIAATHSSSLSCDNVGMMDIVVSEILGSDALSEGVLPAMLHAQTLLAPDGVILPQRIVLMAALLSCGAQLGSMLGKQSQICDQFGVIRSSFASIAPLRTSVHLPDVIDALLLSEAATFSIDLSVAPLPQSAVLTSDTLVTKDGEADGILLWFQVCFDGGAFVATGPHDGWRSHWPQTALALPPRRVASGEKVALTLEYSGDRTTVRLADV